MTMVKCYIDGIEPFYRSLWTVKRVVLRAESLKTAGYMIFVLLIQGIRLGDIICAFTLSWLGRSASRRPR